MLDVQQHRLHHAWAGNRHAEENAEHGFFPGVYCSVTFIFCTPSISCLYRKFSTLISQEARLCLGTGWFPVTTGSLLEGWGLFQLCCIPQWHKTGILQTKPDFFLLHPHCSTICTLAPVRSPHCIASKFSTRAAKFLTWRKNKGLEKCGETMKHLDNNFNKSQASGTCHTNASTDTFPPPQCYFRTT